MRVLLVEDERLLAERLARGLREEGYAVDLAFAKGEAADRAEQTDYDLVLLDLILPDGSGLDLLRRWRAEGLGAPVLILTARDRVEERVAGLNAGADDYLTKPFVFQELLARARSLLRRRGAPVRDVLEAGGLRLDRTGRRVERDGRLLELTPKEFSLLEFFLLHPGTVLSRTTIAEHVWDYRYEARSNVIDVMVGRLRQKLEAGGRRRLIHAVKGVGYVLRDEPQGGP